jgi:hypothetical protein
MMIIKQSSETKQPYTLTVGVTTVDGPATKITRVWSVSCLTRNWPIARLGLDLFGVYMSYVQLLRYILFLLLLVIR